jgi:hypothetical protein
MQENTNKYGWSSKMGLFTGALLLGLGVYAFIKTPANATSRALPVFMITYGLFRLGFSIYQNYFKKKQEL